MRVSWLLTVPAAAVAVSFALSNPDPVALELWPLVGNLTLPLYVAVLAALALGLLCGGLIFWLAGLGTRLKVRRLRKQLEKLESARPPAMSAPPGLAEISDPALGP